MASKRKIDNDEHLWSSDSDHGNFNPVDPGAKKVKAATYGLPPGRCHSSQTYSEWVKGGLVMAFDSGEGSSASETDRTSVAKIPKRVTLEQVARQKIDSHDYTGFFWNVLHVT